MKSLIQRLTALVLIGGLVFISCSDSPSGNNEENPPQLPPVESLEVDLGILLSQPKAVQQSDSAFFRAYFTASILGGFLQLNALPVQILAGATENTPQYNGDGEWEWTYSASGPNGSFSVSLFATLQVDHVSWDFYISAANSQQNFDDVLLLTGTSALDGSEGTWNIYNPGTGNVITSSEWEVGDSSASVTMSVYEDGLNIPVAVISYSQVGITKRVTFENNEDNTLITIEWNTETKAGYIEAPDFNGGVRACWDSSFQDTACTAI